MSTTAKHIPHSTTNIQVGDETYTNLDYSKPKGATKTYEQG
jgi:hypothetical protein